MLLRRYVEGKAKQSSCDGWEILYYQSTYQPINETNYLRQAAPKMLAARPSIITMDFAELPTAPAGDSPNGSHYCNDQTSIAIS